MLGTISTAASWTVARVHIQNSPSHNEYMVDRLFRFSESLGARYNGRWLDPLTFLITMVDVSGHTMPSSPGAVLGAVTVSVAGDIKTANERSRWCRAEARVLSSQVESL